VDKIGKADFYNKLSKLVAGNALVFAFSKQPNYKSA
jgi:hypothetical protein